MVPYDINEPFKLFCFVLDGRDVMIPSSFSNFNRYTFIRPVLKVVNLKDLSVTRAFKLRYFFTPLCCNEPSDSF